MATMKRCSKCGKPYPATTEYFHKSKSKKDGFRYRCKGCVKLQQAQYYEEHRKDCLNKSNQYYQKHQQKVKQRQKQYRATKRGHLRNIFNAMLERCNNPQNEHYKYYGGRGIKVKFECFEDFFDYILNDLKVEPRGLTIDRIDNDGNYEKNNIRFVTRAENNRNRKHQYTKKGAIPCQRQKSKQSK